MSTRPGAPPVALVTSKLENIRLPQVITVVLTTGSPAAEFAPPIVHGKSDAFAAFSQNADEASNIMKCSIVIKVFIAFPSNRSLRTYCSRRSQFFSRY
jgi:hypothetical protein